MANATEIEKLVVSLVGNNKQYLASLDEAAKATTTWSANIRRTVTIGAGAAFAGAAAAATAAGVAIAKAWRDVAPTIDEVTKSAARLGVGTKELGGLRHAAQLAGASAEQLDSGLMEMQKRLANAAAGFGTVGQQLQRFGLDATQLAALPLGERLDVIADALAGIEDAGTRANLATTLFGGSGVKLLNILQDGSGALREMTADAQRLGITFTEEQGKMVAAANDAMKRIGLALDGIKQQIVIAVAPAVRLVADELATWVASFNTASGGATSFARTAVGAFGQVADVVHTLRLAFEGMQALATRAISFVLGAIADFIDTVIRIVNRIPGIQISTEGFHRTLADEMARAAKEQQSQFDTLFQGQTPSERLNAALEDWEAAMKEQETTVRQSSATLNGGLLANILEGAFWNIAEDLQMSAQSVFSQLAQGAANLLEQFMPGMNDAARRREYVRMVVPTGGRAIRFGSAEAERERRQRPIAESREMRQLTAENKSQTKLLSKATDFLKLLADNSRPPLLAPPTIIVSIP